MRAGGIFLSFALAVGCAIFFQHTASSQEYRGTWNNKGRAPPTSGAMRRSDPRCGQDRGLLAPKYSATKRWVPRRVCTKRCALTP